MSGLLFLEDDFALRTVDADGVERLVSLREAALLSLETGRPVRSFAFWRGQRNYPGLWWAATMGGHVGYESWLERDHAMRLDFEADVVAFAPQPFWLHWTAGGATRLSAASSSQPSLSRDP